MECGGPDDRIFVVCLVDLISLVRARFRRDDVALIDRVVKNWHLGGRGKGLQNLESLRGAMC